MKTFWPEGNQLAVDKFSKSRSRQEIIKKKIKQILSRQLHTTGCSISECVFLKGLKMSENQYVDKKKKTVA